MNREFTEQEKKRLDKASERLRLCSTADDRIAEIKNILDSKEDSFIVVFRKKGNGIEIMPTLSESLINEEAPGFDMQESIRKIKEFYKAYIRAPLEGMIKENIFDEVMKEIEMEEFLHNLLKAREE